MTAWTKTRPTRPGTYLARFCPGWAFEVTVQPDLRCAWPGQVPGWQPLVTSTFFDRAQWHVEGVPTAAAVLAKVVRLYDACEASQADPGQARDLVTEIAPLIEQGRALTRSAS